MKRFAAIFLLLGTLGIPVGCANDESGNTANVEAPAAVVIVKPVRRATVPIMQEYEGTIGAVDQVDVRARVEGVLQNAPFKEGQLVRKGDLIFQIQPEEYDAALSTAQAQLATARAQVGQAQGNLYAREAALQRANTTVARNRPLAADKAIPQKELDNAIQTAAMARGDVTVAKAQIESAQAAVLAGKAGVDNAQLNVGYTNIYAPVSGLIGFRNYDVGNVVGGSTTQVLDTITSIDPIKITFGMDESTYLALSAGRGDPNVAGLRDQDLRIVLANNETYPYPGRIYTVNPTVDPKTGTITIEARFPNPDGLLRPGGFARVRVITERRPNALLVPQTAIIKSQGVDTVYVVDGNNRAALRTVTLGPAYQQAFVVQSGLNAGDRVIVEGTQKVQPGAKVVAKTG